MKYATSAALSLALSLGLAAAAQAQGTQQSSPSDLPPPAASQPQGMQQGSAPEAASPTGQNMSPTMVKQAQQALKAGGLYQGKIDGIVGPETQQALAQFQRQHNLEPTGQLSSDTMARLTGSGVGSTMPSVGTQPESGAGGQPMPGPAAEPTSPGPAGGNGAPAAPGTPPAR